MIIPLHAPIIVEKFLPVKELKRLNKLLVALRKKQFPGIIRTNFDFGLLDPSVKRNRVIDLGPDWQTIAPEFEKNLRMIFKREGIRIPKNMSFGAPQFSSYEKGDFYLPHTDHTPFGITVLFFAFEKALKGGSLHFTETGERISFQENKLIIFPSGMTHEVMKIQAGVRWTLQFFPVPHKAEIFSPYRANRKHLASVIHRLISDEPSDVISVLKGRKLITEFLEKTMTRSFQRFHFEFFRSMGKRMRTKVELNPFSLTVENRQLRLAVKRKGSRLVTEIELEGKMESFPFQMTTPEIVQKLKL